MSIAKALYHLNKDYYDDLEKQRKKRRKAQKNEKIWDLVGTAGSLAGMALTGPAGWGVALGSQAIKNVGKAHEEEKLSKASKSFKFNQSTWRDYRDTKGGIGDNLWNTAMDVGKTAIMKSMDGGAFREMLGLDAASKADKAVKSANLATRKMNAVHDPMNKFWDDLLKERVADNGLLSDPLNIPLEETETSVLDWLDEI